MTLATFTQNHVPMTLTLPTTPEPGATFAPTFTFADDVLVQHDDTVTHLITHDRAYVLDHN